MQVLAYFDHTCDAVSVSALFPAYQLTYRQPLLAHTHRVSSMLSQQDEFGLKRPFAYGYDLFLEGIILIALGLLGLPPTSAVLPQSPLHTRSLMSIEPSKMKNLPKRSGRSIGTKVATLVRSNSSRSSLSHSNSTRAGKSSSTEVKLESYAATEESPDALDSLESHQKAVEEGNAYSRDSLPAVSDSELATPHPSGATGDGDVQRTDSAAFSAEQAVIDAHVSATDHRIELEGVNGRETKAGSLTGSVVGVREQRLSLLYHALLCVVSLFIAPALALVPRAVLHGYFLCMAIWSLPGSQLWHRILFLFKDPAHRAAHKAGDTVPLYVFRVPVSEIAKFTLFQVLALGTMFGISWIGQGGIAFPVVLLVLVPLRHMVLTRLMKVEHLRELDRAKDPERKKTKDSEKIHEERAYDPATYFKEPPTI